MINRNMGFGGIPQSSIPGRVIRTMQDIVPNDVPTDGGIGTFVMQDLSAIYLKQWNSNGYIDELKFVPERQIRPIISQQQNMQASQVTLDYNLPSQNQNESPTVVEKDILDRLGKIESILSELMGPTKQD